MAGQLDSLFKDVAKSVVAQLGASLDHDITYTKKASGSYNTATGANTTSDTTYSINAHFFLSSVLFVQGEESGEVSKKSLASVNVT